MLSKVIHNRALQIFCGIAGLVFIFYLAVMLKGDEVGYFTWWDKFNHFIAFFVASFYYFLISKNNKYVLIGMIAFGLFIEIAQSFTPLREASLWDVFADIIGTFVAYAVYLVIINRTKTT